MHFLAPSLLLGLIAALMPWIIHRIGRRRARPVRFAAMELLLRAEREVSARRRLRDVALLVARTGLAAALPLAFARPFTEVRSDLPAVTTRSQSAVVVLDDSASMRRRLHRDETPFDVAKARARDIVDHLSPDSEIGLALSSEGSSAPVAELSSDRPRVSAALAAVTASARRADFAAALRHATQMLTSSTRGERLIYVVTDLQATGWEDVSPTVLAAGPEIVVLDASGGAPWSNRAVVSLGAEPAPEEGAQGIAVVAEIANYGAEPAKSLGITLRLDGAEVARGFVDVPAGGRARKRFVHSVSGGARQAEVVIDHDGFQLDDRRACRVEVSRGLRVLLVDGDPRTVRTEDEVFFLEAALRAGGSNFAVTTVLPDVSGTRDLTGYGAVFMANVARPSAAVAAAITRYVEGGGGLFISVGDRVDADAWNQSMKAVLPQPLGLKRSAAALPGARPEGETVDTRPAERLAPLDRRHPLLAAFPARGEGLASARFFQFLLLAPVPEAPGRRIVLRYENGAPALVDGEVGRGRVLLLTTSVDCEWTDLPIRPGFLPLVQEAARYLAAAPSGDVTATITVGGKREIVLGSDDRRIEVVKPSGDSRWLTPPAHPGDARTRHTVLFDETDEPGMYRVRAARADGTVDDRPDAAFAVTLDPSESDPARLADEKRPDRARARGAGGPAPRRRLELWHALGAAAIGLVLLESLLTVRFREGQVQEMNKPFGNADTKLSDYVSRVYAPEDEVLAEIRARSAAAGLPDIQVAALDALHLEVIARASGAQRAVEIGTLGGYSGVALLRGMGPNGELDTVEMSAKHAEVARESFRRAGVAARAHIHVGSAADVLPILVARAPFDLVFIDADKENYAAYTDWAADNLRPGGVVLLDNAFLFGQLPDPPAGDRAASIRSMQAAHDKLARGGKFRATVLPTGEGLAFGVRI